MAFGHVTEVPILTIITEYARICLNKQVSEYATLFHVLDKVHTLYKVVSTSRDRGVFRTLLDS